MIQSSIIILAHNDWNIVHKCIQSVIAHTNNYEIIFMVDNSIIFKDELKKFGTIIESKNPFNFAQRVNQGIKSAKGEYFVILNDDTEPHPGWLENMIHANNTLGPGLVGARCQEGGCSNRQARGEGEAIYSKYTLNMFALLIPRRIYDIIGPLDERFIYYGGEDDDYTLRAHRHKIKTIVSAGYVIHHAGSSFSQDRQSILLPKTRELFRNKWETYLPVPPDENWFDATRQPFIYPLISILMTTRDHQAYIASSIRSVLEQSYLFFELLIGIDGNDQGLAPILSQFNDKRIKVLTEPVAIGSCAMRNKLFSSSSGEFVAIMDSDDIMLPDRLSKQLMAMSTDIDIIHSGYFLEKDSRQAIAQTYPINKNMLLSGGHYVAGGTFLMRRWVLERALFSQNFHRAFDLEFILRNFDKFSFYHLPEPTIIYRRHEGNHESGNAESKNQHQKLIEAYQ